jgi:xanthine/CO dehydrogenase XdhC/CoxF family maturation factor
VFTIDHSREGDELWGSGLGCRGVLDLLAEPAALARETITALGAARRDGEAVVLLTELDGTRRRLRPEEVPDVVASGRPARVGDAVADPILPPPHLVVCGAGPDAGPLVGAAAELGWRVTVADPRRRLLAAARVDPATRIDVTPDELPNRLGQQPVDAVVVMSHDFLRDAAFLGAFAGRGVPYLGVLGPRDRTERLVAELGTRGIALTDADRAALHAPAGLDLGADGPQEVALAVVAEILSVLRGAAGGPLRDRPGPIHPPM